MPARSNGLLGAGEFRGSMAYRSPRPAIAPLLAVVAERPCRPVFRRRDIEGPPFDDHNDQDPEPEHDRERCEHRPAPVVRVMQLALLKTSSPRENQAEGRERQSYSPRPGTGTDFLSERSCVHASNY